ncbi:hypothetical protein [Microbacterium sp.]|uniref:hypothetical protein n=1 Tax=Microbacterium sp. TaxID=51671 RepID=UPI003F9DF548
MDDAEFEKVYGVWEPRTPDDVARLFADYPGTWWIAGGWALEAFTGVRRHHEDIDPSVLRDELPLLRRHLAGRLHIWTASSGALKPLLSEDRPDASADEVLLEGSGQVWTRPDAAHPWEYDILLSPGSTTEWIYKRDQTIRMPMADALWSKDGVRYLQPEIQLLYKSKGQRPKDDADFDATLPFLDEYRRGWLRAALERTLPEHDWLRKL